MQMGLSLVTRIIDDLLDLGKGGAPISSNMLLAFALFSPSLAVAVRRLHDMNRSGWAIFSYVGMYLAVIIGGLILSMIFSAFGLVLMVLGLIGVTGGYIFLMASEGNRGDNSGHDNSGSNGSSGGNGSSDHGGGGDSSDHG